MEETRKPVRKPRAAVAPKPAAKKAAAAAAKPAARRTAAGTSPKAKGPPPAEREAMVRMAAYFRAERRGFEPGHEWDDWLAAEIEVATQPEPAPAVKPRKVVARKT
jgi:hypothetical protein